MAKPLFAPPPQLFGKATQLKRMKIREISLVDNPASPGAEIILTKRMKGGDVMKIRVTPLEPIAKQAKPTPPLVLPRVKRKIAKSETPADADAVISRSLAHMPVASESYDRWVKRVFQGTISGFDLRLARSIFDLLSKAAAVRSSASTTLEKMAKSRAAETGQTFERSYTDLVKTPAGQSLYEIVKTKIAPPALPLSADAQAAADELQGFAKRIQTEESCTPQQAFALAATRFPSIYARSRGYDR